MTNPYVVGIDLGTTHSALAFAELVDDASVAMLAIPQLVAHATMDNSTLLPSFLYVAHESEGAQKLPWDSNRSFAVGHYARTRGVDAPNRLVSSAKSWLSHSGIDRRASMLPLLAADDLVKMSPVDASKHYLTHLSEAWRESDPKERNVSKAQVVLTVPASFDAGARDLTVEAAQAAGYENVTLLEEPQAALYAWIHSMGDSWRKHVHVGDIVLVVDIGGGTTDFSAIAAVEKEGSLELVRVAVGDHILLGGDNMDLALAHCVNAKFQATGKELDRWQMASLTHACRIAKEQLLANEDQTTVPVVVPGRGSKLMGGSLRSEVTHADIQQILVDGFFPVVAADARPATRTRAALTQVGLPYASDAAITKHLALFLTRQADATAKLSGMNAVEGSGKLLRPTSVLFNGGVMKSAALRNRIMQTLNSWLEKDGATAAKVLPADDMDLAVARGAVCYGLARQGKGIRIRGGTARAYYVGIEGAVPAVPGMEPPITALCVAPFGMEEGTAADLSRQELGVVVGEPVRFRFFSSTVRRNDVVGTELERWKEGELEEVAPIEMTLPAEGRREGDVVPVYLNSEVTAIGTLALKAKPSHPLHAQEGWKVELNVRSHEE